MDDKLLPYQKDHVLSLSNSIKKHSRALDASDTGTGKTYTSIALCTKLKLRPFIICPKSVISSWINILTSFTFKTNPTQFVISDPKPVDLTPGTIILSSDGNYTRFEKKK